VGILPQQQCDKYFLVIELSLYPNSLILKQRILVNARVNDNDDDVLGSTALQAPTSDNT